MSNTIQKEFWYGMELGERKHIEGGEWQLVIRVPGGWVYRAEDSAVFIPWSKEFEPR